MAYVYEVQYEVQRMSMSTDYKLSGSTQHNERYRCIPIIQAIRMKYDKRLIF